MAFVAEPLIKTTGNIHAHLYLHQSGLYSAFPVVKSRTPIQEATYYSMNTLESLTKTVGNRTFFITVARGDYIKPDKILDIFGYSTNEWPGNPDVESWLIRAGVLVKEHTPITCEDSLIMLGFEGQHRRKCRNLEEYMRVGKHILPSWLKNRGI